ncbi:winged helix DNA-binding domain-containing protein [Agromyces sp. LHK192]|uniref:winged helix DNA-binding domain-containing protein n=1 Tax=Agromyces sp. LHK192 TaxID=2498704 RepID=UPI000FDBE029|nr:winged helix DNA-binding domain-containing protein [Agromyces sp. LHK192]
MTSDRDLARWRLRSQLLSAPAGDAEHVVGTLLAVQAENPSQSAWAVATRTAATDPADLAGALAEARVVRTHVLRSTWHYVHADDAQWLIELTAPRVLAAIDSQVQPFAERITELTDAVVETLGKAPDRTRPELAASLADRRFDLTGHDVMILLAYLEMQTVICSGAPRDGEHTYALFADRVRSPRRLERDEALAELATRYFSSHGPATERDLAYWATLTLGDVRRGIAAAGDRLASFEHDGRRFLHAASDAPDAASGASAEPAAHLLQLLDEMYRGYQDSRWVIDREGIVPRAREAAIGMAVVDGQLLAGMKRTVTAKGVTFALHPHRPFLATEVEAIEAAAARYGAFLGLEPRVAIA